VLLVGLTLKLFADDTDLFVFCDNIDDLQIVANDKVKYTAK